MGSRTLQRLKDGLAIESKAPQGTAEFQSSICSLSLVFSDHDRARMWLGNRQEDFATVESEIDLSYSKLLLQSSKRHPKISDRPQLVGVEGLNGSASNPSLFIHVIL